MSADRPKSQPMPVKHWTFAGLVLTDWCSASCASCYLSCSPSGQRWMTLSDALGIWQSLIDASPHGCRIHLSGGEPFGNWDLLAEICRQGHRQHLGPLDKVETNAFWATDDRIVRDRVGLLDACGMGKLAISADPYHQQFVPIANCRRAARVAREMLGAARVQVRWEDWLKDGFDLAPLAPAERQAVFEQWDRRGRDRHNGRGATLPAAGEASAARRPVASSCREGLLRGRHVHVDFDGWVTPGVCAGLVLGRWGKQSIGQIWDHLNDRHETMPIIGPLAAGGPSALLPEALATGFVPSGTQGDKCSLCWSIRRHLAGRGLCPEHLGPAWVYRGGKG